ncbi:MAG: hypothetical protein M1387_03140 [Thaumarchaeota archaeon]|nr:hypothetical protein [Nitrososphaerota archaeon]
MSLYKAGFKNALELLQKRLQEGQISDIQSVFQEIESMNTRVNYLQYHDFQLLEMPQPVLHALLGVTPKQ